jgi:hypothetical protein
MNMSLCMQLARLRILVGYLGEHHQYNWWPSAFFTPSSRAFLTPIFSKTAFMAQYQGMKAAASRVHDEHIGLGKVYHLFRLPERLEQALYHSLQDKVFVESLGVPLYDKDQALENLATCADSHATTAEGPVLVGHIAELLCGKTFGRLAQHYWSAFARNTHVYPYYGEQP